MVGQKFKQIMKNEIIQIEDMEFENFDDKVILTAIKFK
tara:strand:- start:40 stop:153 length:114 start_codon:yes stop_codon:yes gene_type:complete